AWATVVSQLLSSILCYIYSVVRYPVFRLTREDFKTTYKFCMEHLKVGFPMAFQFSITAIGTIIIQASLNDFGADAMSGFTVANKIEGLIVQSFCALGVAMATYCGQNFGAKRYDRIKTGIKSATIIVLICSVFAAVINLTMTNIFVDLFLTDPNPAIIDYARQYLTILAFFYPALALLFVYRNSLQGMGQNLIPFLGGVGELVARSVVAVTLPAVIGYVGVCMASPLAWIAAAIPLTVKVILVVNKLVPRTIKSISINRHTALSAQDKDK
ncbi:MAG: MATE family efflux transporter, partial [Clostridia bacterium]